VKNYEFDYDFGPPWGSCSVTFTSVAGHVMSEDFPETHAWGKCDPLALFEAPIERKILGVSF
jgi:DNA topoisomerase-3